MNYEIQRRSMKLSCHVCVCCVMKLVFLHSSVEYLSEYVYECVSMCVCVCLSPFHLNVNANIIRVTYGNNKFLSSSQIQPSYQRQYHHLLIETVAVVARTNESHQVNKSYVGRIVFIGGFLNRAWNLCD